MPFLFYLNSVCQNSLPLTWILTGLSKSISSFSFHTITNNFPETIYICEKKLEHKTTINIFLFIKIYYTLIFFFHNAICIRVASTPNSFALHLPTTAARADASTRENNSCTYLYLIFLFFFSSFFFFLPFSFPFTYNENELRIWKYTISI